MSKKQLFSKHQSQTLLENLIFASAKDTSAVQKKHQKIVDGASKTFFKKGYHPTTIREIATASGMSMGQLYHYISSKDDVLYLMHKHMQTVWHEYLRKSDVERIKDPLQKLTKALHQTLEFVIENKKLIQFVYTESKYLDEKHLRIVLEMDYNNVIGFWYTLLKEVNKQKPVKGDLYFLASLIAYINAFPAIRGWTLRGRPRKKDLDYSISFILKGLGII